MVFSSVSASLCFIVFVAVAMVLPPVSVEVGAAYTYQTNLGKIDPAIFAPPSSTASSTTSTPDGRTASISQNNPTPAGFSVAVGLNLEPLLRFDNGLISTSWFGAPSG